MTGSELDRRQSWKMKGCVFPSEFLYDVDRDLWAEVLEDGTARIGLTDVGQTAAGKLRVVSFPHLERHLGEHLKAGKAVAVMESAKWVGALQLPTSGRLVAANLELVDHPLWINLEPYGNGWVVTYRPDSPIPWLAGEEARSAYQERLKQTFRSVQGVNEDFWCVHCNDWDEL